MKYTTLEKYLIFIVLLALSVLLMIVGYSAQAKDPVVSYPVLMEITDEQGKVHRIRALAFKINAGLNANMPKGYKAIPTTNFQIRMKHGSKSCPLFKGRLLSRGTPKNPVEVLHTEKKINACPTFK